MSVTPLTFPQFIDTTADEQRWQIYNATASPASGSGTFVSNATVSTAATILAAATRQYLLIQNVGTTNAMYITTDGSTPTATNGFTLAANGGGIVFDGSFVPSGDIKAFSTSTNYTILWA
jgi:hypothetical protein